MNLSFHNKRAFFQKVDSLPTFNAPEFKCETIEITGDKVDEAGKPETIPAELWMRNPVEVIHQIIGNPALKNDLAYAPVQIFTDESQREQVFNEMNTGHWWWRTQVSSLPSLQRYQLTINSPNYPIKLPLLL